MTEIHQGALLRAWRLQEGLTQTRLAEMLVESAGSGAGQRLGKASVSKWETDALRPPPWVPEHLDSIYRAGGALVGLHAAMGTPRGLPPRQSWTFNLTGPSGPAWAWIRAQHAPCRLRAELVWGPLRIRWAGNVAERGLIITSGTSVENPPLVVRLDVPGWVDVGKGTVPKALGFPQIAAEAHLENHNLEVFLYAAVQTLRRAINGPDRDRLAPIARQVYRIAAEVGDRIPGLRSRSQPEDLVGRPSARSPATPFSGEQYRSLREARGYSLQATADRMSSLSLATRAGSPDGDRSAHQSVTKEHVRRLEQGHEPRRLRYPRSRLDTVLGAGGVTMLEPVEERQMLRRPRETLIAFPAFWIGPIWLEVRHRTGTNEPALLHLHWGPWTKAVRVSVGTRVTCRRASADMVPLRIVHSPRHFLAAGLGEDPRALDINVGWLPGGNLATSPIWEDYRNAHVHLSEHTHRILRRF